MIKKILTFTFIIFAFVIGINYFVQDKTDASINSRYSNCELGDLVGDDVKRIRYKGFNLDYHTEDFTKSQVKDYAKKCVEEGVKNQYQFDCCMTMNMYPDESNN